MTAERVRKLSRQMLKSISHVSRFLSDLP